MRRFLLAPLAALLVACPPTIDTGNDGGGVITAGPSGGIFIRNGAMIDIPRDALTSTVNITVTVVDSAIPEVPGRKRISLGYRFSPSTLTFAEPVKIGLAWDPARVPEGVEPATFDMRRQAGNEAYTELPGTQVYSEGEYSALTARSDRLGLFWITSPAQPAVSQLSVTPAEASLAVGGTQAFTAQALDPTGSPLELTVSWTVVPSRAAAIDQAGVLRADGPGTATVTATAGTLVAQAVVHIRGATAGPVTFAHDNPWPTGNDLLGGQVTAQGSFFVGANGTALAQSTSGQWTRLFSSPGITLKAIGATASGVVAVGSAGNLGVLVEAQSPTAAPTLKTFTTAQPGALAFDGIHGMAVGQGNDVLVLKQGKWTTEYSPSFERLLAVAGDGQGGFTTLGDRGSLYRFDPTTSTWNSLYQSQLSVLLGAAVLTDQQGTEAWAVGGGKLWHFQVDHWSAGNLPPSFAAAELTAVGQLGGQVVVGARLARQGWLLTFDPSGADGGAPTDGGVAPDGGAADAGPALSPGWSATALRRPQVPRSIFGSGAEGWAVGDFGAVWRYQAGTFTEKSHGFFGDVADVWVAGSAVFAAVNECTDPTCLTRVGRVVTRTGTASWADVGQPPFTGALSSLVARSATDVLASGEDGVFHYDGMTWTPVSAVGGPFFDLALCGDTVWAVGASGQVNKGTMTGLSQEAAIGAMDLRSISCTAPTDIWYAGDYSLYERSGGGQAAYRSSNGVNPAPWRAVWSPGAGEAFAFGAARYGVYWDGSKLSVFDMPGGVLPDTLAGLWGSSVDNLYAVGWTVAPVAFGYAVRFDGAQWSLVDAASQRRVTSIHGSSATEIWLGTEGGGLLRGVMP